MNLYYNVTYNIMITCMIICKMARRSKEVNEQVSLKLKDAAVIFNQAKKLNQRCQIFRDSLRLLRGKEFASVEVEDGVRRQCEELEERLRHVIH